MFAVLETTMTSENLLNLRKSFIGTVDSIKECKTFWNQHAGEGHVLITDSTLEKVLKDDTVFGPGRYVIEEESKVTVLEKISEILRGYIYNSNSIKTNIVQSRIDCRAHNMELFR